VSDTIMSQLDDELVQRSLAEVFNAAWTVIGRRAYSLHREEEEQLRCDLASFIGRLVVSGVDDHGELLRRSIQRFLH
jgi:hypothetical protein